MTTATKNREHSVDGDALEAIDYCYEQGWAADGLPVVPPEASRVQAMLSMEGRPPETIIAHHPATGNECSIRAAAVNAVMAGCIPEYFPVIVAALEAMNEPDFNFHGSTASTGGSAHVLFISGPVVEDIGMNSAGNCLGQGNRANATIGRAVRLIIMNVFEMIPGVSDQSTQGTPAKYSACIAERQDVSPWAPMNVELGYPKEVSSVTTFAGSGFINCENHGGNKPEAVLGSIADAMANLASMSIGQSAVILAPEHIGVIANAGWSRRKVQEYLFEKASQPVSEMKRVMKYSEKDAKKQDLPEIHRGLSPDDIWVMVSGGLAGGHSTVITSWSRSRLSLMQSKPIGVCLDC